MRHKIFSDNSLKEIDVVILSGGQGTRLREIIGDHPKPMAKINQYPFLDILIEYVSSYGFRRFILSTGYLAEVIEEYYKTKNAPQEVLFSREDKPLGTGGAVKKAEKLIESSPFAAAKGDCFGTPS